MSISKKMRNALNDQVNAEIASGYLYAAMSADFKAKNLEGFASWMAQQAQEELAHARKIYSYLYDQDERVEYKTLEAPQAEWGDAEKTFEAVLAHEKKVTAMIHALVKLARDEDDLATESFLSWFVDEQVEEEDSARTVLDKIKMVSQGANGLYLLDRELAARGQG